MNNEKMAKFIYEMRKSEHMTQKQLAEKLNITDKAVSKWERELGYPDISILPSLAEILGVTANELLNGERSSSVPSDADAIVETTLQYANKVTSHKNKSIKLIAKIAITASSFLSIFICIICDIAISGTLSWSLYPIVAILFAWIVIFPLFQFKKNNVCISLISLSIFIIPFLFILDKIIGGTKLMMPLGVPIAIVSIIYIWVIYFLFSIKRSEKWNMAAISVLLGIPVSIIINYIVSKFMIQPMIDVWDILSYGIMIVISVLLFFIGKKQKA